MVGQGMENYVFMRPGPQEKHRRPGPVFWWEAPDGSRVLTYRIPLSYKDLGSDMPGSLRRIIKVEPGPIKDLMAFYGVGDHGGGTTKRNIRSILDTMKQPGGPEILVAGDRTCRIRL